MTVQQQQQQQPFAAGGDYAERLVRVERDVAGLKEGITALGQTVDKGFRELADRSRFSWQPIGILVTGLGLVGSLFFGFLNASQGRLETVIAKHELRADRFVPREDLDNRFLVLSQRRDDLQRLTDARIERAERDVEALQKAMVPRGEHAEVWAGQRTKDEGLQRQIDGLRKDLSDLNTPRDTIQGMQRRLDDLDRALRGTRGSP